MIEGEEEDAGHAGVAEVQAVGAFLVEMECVQFFGGGGERSDERVKAAMSEEEAVLGDEGEGGDDLEEDLGGEGDEGHWAGCLVWDLLMVDWRYLSSPGAYYESLVEETCSDLASDLLVLDIQTCLGFDFANAHQFS